MGSKMGRMHAPGKGMASSALPYVRKAPNWSKNKVQKSEVVTSILKLQKMGLRPSAIGVHLRDQMGISQSKYITGNKILRILKANGVAVDLPEDLYFLIKKAVTMRKHLDKNRKDKHGKFRLNPESTDWLDITEPRLLSSLTGNTIPKLLLLWFHNQFLEFYEFDCSYQRQNVILFFEFSFFMTKYIKKITSFLYHFIIKN